MRCDIPIVGRAKVAADRWWLGLTSSARTADRAGRRADRAPPAPARASTQTQALLVRPAHPTRNMPPTLVSLPGEVLLCIYDWLYELERESGAKTCAPLCRALVAYTQTLLYRDIKLKTAGQLELLARTLVEDGR